MGIETGEAHGGADCSFTSAIIAIEGESLPSVRELSSGRDGAQPGLRDERADLVLELVWAGTELAKVDPSVSVMADVHNTLVRLDLSSRPGRKGEGGAR